MKSAIAVISLVGALTISGVAFAGQPATTPPGYTNNPGEKQAFSHVAPGCNSDVLGVFGFSGAGAGGFGFQTGQGNNQAGGNNGTPNYNPLLCGNANDNALVRGPN